jgi:hypothetical protein
MDDMGGTGREDVNRFALAPQKRILLFTYKKTISIQGGLGTMRLLELFIS